MSKKTIILIMIFLSFLMSLAGNNNNIADKFIDVVTEQPQQKTDMGTL